MKTEAAAAFRWPWGPSLELGWISDGQAARRRPLLEVHFFFLHFTMNDDSVMADLSFVKAIIVDGDFEMHNVNKGLKL